MALSSDSGGGNAVLATPSTRNVGPRFLFTVDDAPPEKDGVLNRERQSTPYQASNTVVPGAVDNGRRQLGELSIQHGAIDERAKNREKAEVARYAREQAEAAKRTAELLARNEEERRTERERLEAIERDKAEFAELRRRKSEFDKMARDYAERKKELERAKKENDKQREDIKSLKSTLCATNAARDMANNAEAAARKNAQEARRLYDEANTKFVLAQKELESAQKRITETEPRAQAEALKRYELQTAEALKAKEDAVKRKEQADKRIAEADAQVASAKALVIDVEGKLATAYATQKKLSDENKQIESSLAGIKDSERRYRATIIDLNHIIASYEGRLQLIDPYEKFEELANDSIIFTINFLRWANTGIANASIFYLWKDRTQWHDGWTLQQREAARKYVEWNKDIFAAKLWQETAATVHFRLAWTCRKVYALRSNPRAVEDLFAGNTGTPHVYNLNRELKVFRWPPKEIVIQDLDDAAFAITTVMLSDLQTIGNELTYRFVNDFAESIERFGGAETFLLKYGKLMPADFLLTVLYLCFTKELKDFRSKWARTYVSLFSEKTAKLFKPVTHSETPRDEGIYFKVVTSMRGSLGADDDILFAIVSH